MQRNRTFPREYWQQKVESQGLTFHTPDEPYWNESAYYSFFLDEILEIERATEELYRICCLAVENVIKNNLWQRFQIPEAIAPMIRRSWIEDDAALYGRFDLAFHTGHPPKLYEFNADTPTSLLEAAVVQWYWLQDRFPKLDQFNSLHEKLIAHWKISEVRAPIHFTCCRDTTEELATVVYLQDTAMQAGFETERLYIDEIGWNGNHFVDLKNHPILTLFKLYPWEWLVREPFAVHLPKETCQIIEPSWKMILSTKELLVLLWEMFPGHPNLLPAYSTPEKLGDSWIKKPVFGRGGAGITTQSKSRQNHTEGGPAIEAGFIYQELLDPPVFDNLYPVIGSWIVGGVPAGMGIRESKDPVTTEQSCFVPHLILS